MSAPQDPPTYGFGLIGDLRNWVKAAQPNGSIMVPSSIARWGEADGQFYRRGEFLHVKVVDLNQLFCRVELTDTACPPLSTISGGAGYAVGDVITFNVGSYPFSFTALGASFSGESGILAGNPPQILAKPFSGSTTDPGNGSRISGSSSRP